MSVTRFDLDKEPRFAVFRNKKINLLFLLRPHIMESIFAETKAAGPVPSITGPAPNGGHRAVGTKGHMAIGADFRTMPM